LKSTRLPTEPIIAAKKLVKRLKRALNRSGWASAKRNVSRNSKLSTHVLNARLDLDEGCETTFKCLLNFFLIFFLPALKLPYAKTLKFYT
jgi:hypothetical protein